MNIASIIILVLVLVALALALRTFRGRGDGGGCCGSSRCRSCSGCAAAGLCVSDDKKRRASNKTFTK